jgi:hypothetical protein
MEFCKIEAMRSYLYFQSELSAMLITLSVIVKRPCGVNDRRRHVSMVRYIGKQAMFYIKNVMTSHVGIAR